MNILVIRSNPVDPDPRVEKEVKALIDVGYNVEIFAWNREEDHPIVSYKLQDDQSVIVNRIGIKATYGGGMKSNIGPLLKFQLAIFKWVTKNKKKIDIIHACDFDTALMSMILKKLYKKKLVYDIFDYYVDAFSVPSALKKLIEKLDHLVINNSDAVIICSEERIKQIEGSNPKELLIIHNTPKKIEEISPNHYLSSNIKIAYFGILSESRLLLELTKIVSKDMKFELHIGGFGAIENQIKEYSSNYSNIKYYGKIPYEDVIKYESECDILFACYDPKIPNHKYAAPNKFYEALMLGKPILMVKETGMSSVIEHENIGVTIEYSIQGIENGLKDISSYVKNKEVKHKMRELYDNKYSWELMRKKLIYLYEKLH